MTVEWNDIHNCFSSFYHTKYPNK